MESKVIKFYMVKNTKDGIEYATAIMHPTWEDAEAEAQRLAKKHPGQTFVIMESTYFFREPTAKEKLTSLLKGLCYNHAALETILENFEVKEISKNQ